MLGLSVRTWTTPLGVVHVRTLYDGDGSCIPMQDIGGDEFCID